MRGGDIDTELAPIIAIRFERIIKTEEGKLNTKGRAFLQSIMRLNVNVHVITTEDPRKCISFCYKWGVPYNKVIDAAGELEIPDICRAEDVLTYYDTDKSVLQNINTRGHGKIEAKLWTSD